MEDLPTSKTIAVFIGLVELKGTAEIEMPFTSFLSGERCVYYAWVVEEHYRRGSGKNRRSGSEEVASGGETGLFYLRDDLGILRIDPRNAKIVAETVFTRTCTKSDPLYYGKGPNTSVYGSTGKRTFTEKAITLHQPIYVVGQARERADCVAAEIAHDRTAPIFLISTWTKESLRAWKRWLFWGLGILAVLLPVLVEIGIGLAEGAGDSMLEIGIPIALSGAMLAIWGIGWFWIVYNSLIALKNRVKMATANVDVELKRRFDLIPQILRVIEEMKQHERQLQETVVLLRSQGAIDSLSEDAPCPAKGCSRQLLGVVENYPELMANESFMKQRQNLSETEQRIALARNYYNDVIETYNNRCKHLPENMVAWLAGMKPIPPFQAEDFERENIEVRLAE